MTITAKVPGTKYTLEMKLEGDNWNLALMIGSTEEERVPVKNLTLREISSSVDNLLKEAQANVNPFQKELMSKDLYRQTSGDEDMSSHSQRQKEIQDKIEKTESGEFQGNLVNEFKSQFKIQEENPKKVEVKERKMPEKERKVIDANKERPEMKSMLSEINQSLGQRTSTPNTTSQSARTSTQVDTRVSSVDVDDLIKELLETKNQLQQDINRVNQRMEKIDNIINKITSISSK